MSRTGGLVPYKRQWNFRNKGWCELCRQPLSHNGRDYWWHVGGKRDHLQLELVYASLEMFPYRRWKHQSVIDHFSLNDEGAQQGSAAAAATALSSSSGGSCKSSSCVSTRSHPPSQPSVGLRAMYKKFDEQGLDRRRELLGLLSFLMERGIVSKKEEKSWTQQGTESGKSAHTFLRKYIFNIVIANYPIADTAGAAGMCQLLVAPRYLELVYDMCGFHTLFGTEAEDKLDHDRVYDWRHTGNYGGYNEFRFKEEIAVTRKTAYLRGVIAQLKWSLMDGESDEEPWAAHPLHWNLTPDIQVAAKQFMLHLVHELMYLQSAESMARVEPVWRQHANEVATASEKGQNLKEVYMSVDKTEAPAWQQQGLQLLSNPAEYGVVDPLDPQVSAEQQSALVHTTNQAPAPPGFEGDLIGLFPRNPIFAGLLKRGSRTVKDKEAPPVEEKKERFR